MFTCGQIPLDSTATFHTGTKLDSLELRLQHHILHARASWLLQRVVLGRQKMDYWSGAGFLQLQAMGQKHAGQRFSDCTSEFGYFKQVNCPSDISQCSAIVSNSS